MTKKKKIPFIKNHPQSHVNERPFKRCRHSTDSNENTNQIQTEYTNLGEKSNKMKINYYNYECVF